MSTWTIKRDAATFDAGREYRKFVTNRVAIVKCLRTKNNLSALGIDGIGYLFLKLGDIPMIEFIRSVFEECVRAADAPDTWKQPHTVFIFEKGETNVRSNKKPITITSCLYRLYMAMNATFIQMKMHKQDKLRVFSNSQKGFVAGVPGCMEHAVMTRELMAHAIHNKRDLHMIQIDLTNAFGSVPHGLIEHNMRCMGLPVVQVETLMKIYQGATTRIVVPTGMPEPINRKGGTVQGCPLSPTLFNICLESFLRLLEKEEYQQYGFRVLDRAGNEVTSINVATHADNLILCSESREGAQAMFDALADFCNYSGMEVNTKKCLSVSITWSKGHREDQYQPFMMRKGRYPMDHLGMPIPDAMDSFCHPEEIPLQDASIYLGLPIGFNNENGSLHGALVLDSMKA
jgi:hypothetical protein